MPDDDLTTTKKVVAKKTAQKKIAKKRVVATKKVVKKPVVKKVATQQAVSKTPATTPMLAVGSDNPPQTTPEQPEVVKKVVKKTVAKKVATRHAVSKNNAASTTPPQVTPEQRYLMIQEAAYYRAEKRGFAPGWELQDWADSEKEIDSLLKK
jgi:hypothetical protein